MTTWITLLRGINVGGRNKIKMDALKLLYENLGFKDVRNYLQSGNVIFRSGETDPVRTGNLISSRLYEVWGMDVPVLALTTGMLDEIFRNNPYLNDNTKDLAYQYITFLFSDPGEYDRDRLNTARSEWEAFTVKGRAVYLYCPKGYGTTKLSNTFFEKKLKVPATTRNLKTAGELLRQSLEY
jgi:uncharacterized protein (DUF1697 family)